MAAQTSPFNSSFDLPGSSPDNGGSFLRRSEDGLNLLWRRLTRMPIVRNWKGANDALFCLTSFPIGLSFFLIGIIGFTLGAGLSLLGIGLVFLAITVILMLWGARIERGRLNAFLGTGIDQPRFVNEPTTSPLNETWQVAKSPAMWRQLFYMGLLFPISLVEFCVVMYPIHLIWSGLSQLIFGTTFGADGLAGMISGPFTALLVMGFAVLLAVPVLFLANIMAKIHGRIGQALLGTATRSW